MAVPVGNGLLPNTQNMTEIVITGEERDDTVWNDLTEGCYRTPKVGDLVDMSITKLFQVQKFVHTIFSEFRASYVKSNSFPISP